MSDNFDIEKLGVFQVYTGSGTGSGFLVGERLLVTNCHVVAPYRTVAVEQRDKRRIVGNVRRVHPRRDLAIVELSAPITGELLPLATDVELRANQAVQIVGFPIGLPLSITEGVVSNPRQLVDGQHFVQTDAAINPGNSGGPILDEHRRIVAMTTCKFSSADMIGFGIPSTDVRQFVEEFRAQSSEFGVVCPSCDALLDTPDRYCNSCGEDLEGIRIASYFEQVKPHPIAAFVEAGLARADIDPVLARHGKLNWSFHSGSAPIKIWCCCPDHLCFASPLAQPGKQKQGDLFRFLLSPEHQPFSFALYGNVIELGLTFHATDIFEHGADEELSGWISKFVASADQFDNLLVEKYGCDPAPETQLTFLKEQSM